MRNHFHIYVNCMPQGIYVRQGLLTTLTSRQVLGSGFRRARLKVKGERLKDPFSFILSPFTFDLYPSAFNVLNPAIRNQWP